MHDDDRLTNTYCQSECVTTPTPTRHMPMKITAQKIVVKFTVDFYGSKSQVTLS